MSSLLQLMLQQAALGCSEPLSATSQLQVIVWSRSNLQAQLT
jgi:hypothetical protein